MLPVHKRLLMCWKIPQNITAMISKTWTAIGIRLLVSSSFEAHQLIRAQSECLLQSPEVLSSKGQWFQELFFHTRPDCRGYFEFLLLKLPNSADLERLLN